MVYGGEYFMKLPYKKMIREKSFLGFSAYCDCGHKHTFSTKDLDINTKNLTEVKFKKVYTCPRCESEYDGMFDIPETSKWKNLSPIGVLLSIILLTGIGFGGFKFIDTLIIKPNQPKEFNEITNKEYQEFKEWEKEHDQQEFEDSKISN